jgi:hypothetical protein
MHKFGKNRPKIDFFEKLIFYSICSKTVSNVFHDLKIAEKSSKIGQFRFEKSW